ncbi:hypothetical protein AMK16_02550 [Streptomyces sp. CB00455]|uniref:hypothetical protein n=1 Tax=Streptomyces sp. CB00455 TaxID=1703927 RepID=UPI00093EA42C|nr:hypothetical protein [Streptomyces sp. CB00455]OKK22108.1 hypothetical protein AMK16_02550 [Streptomyces sp. CB00455]
MDDQGGAGGAPLHGDDEEAPRRRPHPQRREAHRKPEGTRAQDTDEASRLDQPPDPAEPHENRPRWRGPAGH